MAILQKMAISLITGEAKKFLRKAISIKTNGLVESFLAEKPEKTQARVESMLGYPTTHFKLAKDGTIQFKLSPVFLFEWLTVSPENAGRLLKDEESGQVFIDGNLLDNAAKMKLINRFLEVTKIQASSVYSTFENALKLLNISDLIAAKFKSEFATNSESTDTIDNWLSNCFGEGLSTDLPYANNLFRKWLVGTARRAMNPGTTLDGCFTLQGPPGTGKTSFFRQILPPPFDMRAGEVDCKNISNSQKLLETTIGRTIVCFDELAVLNRFSVEAFKQLITKQSVQVRLAWRRDAQQYNLRQGFCATTNKDKFIVDQNMSRRMWVCALNGKSRCNFDYLHANRINLWKEAVRLAQTDFSCYLSPDEQKAVENNNTKYVI